MQAVVFYHPISYSRGKRKENWKATTLKLLQRKHHQSEVQISLYLILVGRKMGLPDSGSQILFYGTLDRHDRSY